LIAADDYIYAAAAAVFRRFDADISSSLSLIDAAFADFSITLLIAIID